MIAKYAHCSSELYLAFGAAGSELLTEHIPNSGHVQGRAKLDEDSIEHLIVSIALRFDSASLKL